MGWCTGELQAELTRDASSTASALAAAKTEIGEQKSINEGLSAELESMTRALEDLQTQNTRLLATSSESELMCARAVADRLKVSAAHAATRQEKEIFANRVISAQSALQTQKSLYAESEAKLKAVTDQSRTAKSAIAVAEERFALEAKKWEYVSSHHLSVSHQFRFN